MFTGGAAHQQLAVGVPGLDANGFGLIQENAIRNDFGIETGGAKLLRDILGGFVIFRCCC